MMHISKSANMLLKAAQPTLNRSSICQSPLLYASIAPQRAYMLMWLPKYRELARP